MTPSKGELSADSSSGGKPSAWGASPAGEDAFAEFLALQEEDPALQLEDFCAARPELADELRELWAGWCALQPAFDVIAGPLDDPLAVPAGAHGHGKAGVGHFVPGDERYRIEGEIGHGGMGVVYRVWDTHLERTLAMKVVRSKAGAGLATRRVARFLDEARITGRLGHPGIVPIHDVGLDDAGRVYFTMPLVEGHTLEGIFELARRDRGGWSTPRALGVLQRVCEAVGFAHARGVVHRDLKPSNVMVGPFGETYVMDWGLARVLGELETPVAVDGVEMDSAADGDSEAGEPSAEFSDRTREGDVVGTPAYMPPEQAQGRHSELGPAADVYSVGAMLYELLSDERPYAHEHPTTAHELLEHVRSGPPRALSRCSPAAPAELVAICEKAMAREPAQRYGDMGAMATDLRAFLEGRVVRAYEAGGWAEAKKWIGRNRALATSLGGLLLVVVLGTALVAWVQANEKAKVLRLSDFQLLSEYSADADELWPPYPEMVGPLGDWLDKARELAARLPQHEERLAEQSRKAAQYAGGPEAFFDDAEERWQAQKLAELVDGLRAFRERVADVEGRLETARSLRAASIDAHADKWQRAIGELAHEGIHIEPQIGLVPLGRNPQSGLQEFSHMLTDTGLGDGGVVLVLLPGGKVRVGADADAYPYVSDLETPAHEVELAPYFLAKWELTQEQWQGLTGENPSGNAGATPADPRRPVENVSWLEATRVLGRSGLDLPTEAQWEAAARAGTSGRWWTGDDFAELVAKEVIDGYGTYPVGSRSANAYGLYDMLGNVMEWCRDRYGEYELTTTAVGDGERQVEGEGPRVFRGGHCAAPPEEARAALRRYKSEGDRHVFIGVRPMRALD